MRKQVSYIIFTLLFLTSICGAYSQNFRFLGTAKKQSIQFTLKNNLIIIPIEVNGIKLNFILDSGVNTTVLFNLKPSDSLEFKNVQNVTLNGLGAGDPIEGLLSENNKMQLKDIVSPNQKFYIIFDDKFDLSAKLGLTIHGIIGYQLFKDFIITINYASKRILFHKPSHFKYHKVRKWQSFDLEFYNNKPYINTFVKMDTTSAKIPVKLLIDSGGSDALWLFESKTHNIQSSDKYFIDFLGQGLSGSIYGKRSRIDKFYLGEYVLNEPTVSFPDVNSTEHARKFEERNGSIGAKVLKRFKVLFDYPNGRFLLKKNGSFNDNFTYNKSGIDLQYNGKVLVQELSGIPISIMEGGNQSSSNRVRLSFNYEFNFKNSYKIAHIRKDSPAERAGLEEGDIVIKINDNYTFQYSLEELTQKFHDNSRKKIKLYIERDGVNFLYQFELEDLF